MLNFRPVACIPASFSTASFTSVIRYSRASDILSLVEISQELVKLWCCKAGGVYFRGVDHGVRRWSVWVAPGTSRVLAYSCRRLMAPLERPQTWFSAYTSGSSGPASSGARLVGAWWKSSRTSAKGGFALAHVTARLAWPAWPSLI